MGKGSTTQSSRPTFRTGNIRTPADPRVTERQSVPPTFVAADPLTTVTSHDMNGFKIAGRESFGIETIDKRTGLPKSRPVEILDVVRTPEVFVLQRKGRHAGVVRTLDIGDDAALPRYVVPVPVKAERPAKAERLTRSQQGSTEHAERPVLTEEQQAEREARRAERAEHDRQIMAYLRSKGYTGSLNSDIRALALDALAHAVTVEAYASSK